MPCKFSLLLAPKRGEQNYMSTELDFFASNEAQQSKSNFQDNRFTRQIQWLKFAPDQKGQRIDILPMSDTKTHAIIKQHRLHGSTVLCPTMFGKSCPLCDAMAINRKDGWYWQTFKTQDRALFNAIPINKEGKQVVMSPDHKIPIYLYEVSAPQKKAQGCWMLLIGALGSTDPEDAYKKQFFSWDNGSTLKISFIEESFEGVKFAKPSGLEFVHPRFDYSKERAKYEPHLYKIPEIYKEPDVEELAKHLDMMQKSRVHSGGYSTTLAEPQYILRHGNDLPFFSPCPL
jgi:hypothetical protein